MLGVPIDRRAFLRARPGLGAVGLSLLPSAAGRTRPTSSRAACSSRHPEYRNVKISPDGRHLSYLAPLDGVRNLWVAPLAAPNDARPRTRATDRDIGWNYRWAYTNRHLVFFRDHDGDENWRAASVDRTNGAIVPLSPERGVRSVHPGIRTTKFPEEMLLRHNQRDPHYFDLFPASIWSTASSELGLRKQRLLQPADSTACSPPAARRPGRRRWRGMEFSVFERRCPTAAGYALHDGSDQRSGEHRSPRFQRRRPDPLPDRFARPRQGGACRARHGDKKIDGARRPTTRPTIVQVAFVDRRPLAARMAMAGARPYGIRSSRRWRET